MHLVLGASKNMKFRLSQNSTKFDVVARFCEMIPMVKSVLSHEITILPFSRKFEFSRVLQV